MTKENPLYAKIRAGVPMGKYLHHQVCFSFKEEQTPDSLSRIISEIIELVKKCGGKDVGILSLKAAENIDDRKGFLLIESIVFESAEAFINFHSHPEHQKFAEMIAGIADVWVVQDVAIDPGEINYKFPS